MVRKLQWVGNSGGPLRIDKHVFINIMIGLIIIIIYHHIIDLNPKFKATYLFSMIKNCQEMLLWSTWVGVVFSLFYNGMVAQKSTRKYAVTSENNTIHYNHWNSMCP